MAFDILSLLAFLAFILFLLSAGGLVTAWLERRRWYKEWYCKLFMGDDELDSSKRLTSRSGITIPKHVRAEAGFLPGMPVSIETVEDGVLIRKRVPTCRFCGSVHDVVKIHGMEMCGECAAAIRKELDKVGA